MVSTTAAEAQYDVVIVGGGPAGSTAASLIRKYQPELRVLVLEKAIFPRDHVGESQLPTIGAILDEMGVWDDIEAAGFPVKIGASYTWGSTHDRWDFDFYPVEHWVDEPRPARYTGQRVMTAFQVDRAKYDDILLKHAGKLGAEVRQGVQVRTVHRDGDRITGLELDGGDVVTGRVYLDASGAAAILRRAMGVESDAPKALRNIALWDYWDNAEWAIEIGTGATRVQVRSLPYGWIWFIPLGPTRTSIGLICPAEYYKSSGKSKEELYHEALRSQPDVSHLIRNATARGDVESTRDWSHLSERLAGENWLLCGESAGFADPILAAGMHLAHSSARDAAYTIMEMLRGEHDDDWLRTRYSDINRANIRQQIKFATFWYSANGCFTDLQEHCTSIAKDAGFRLTAPQAWRWLSQGGFNYEHVGVPGAGSFSVEATRQLVELFDGTKKCERPCEQFNDFTLNLHNVEDGFVGALNHGRIDRVPCYRKGSKTLSIAGYYELWIKLLEDSSNIEKILPNIELWAERVLPPDERAKGIDRAFQTLDLMIQEQWVKAKRVKGRGFIKAADVKSNHVRFARDADVALEAAGKAGMVKSRMDDA